MKPAPLLRRPALLLAAAVAILGAPSAVSAQIGHSLNFGFGGGTWAGEDYVNITQGIAVDASFLFGVQDSYRIGPVIEYGNFALGEDGDRVDEIDIGVEGRFIDTRMRYSVDPYIALRLGYAQQRTDDRGLDASTSGLLGQAAAGFFFPFGGSDHAGDLSLGVRGVSFADWENQGTTVENSGGAAVYWFVRVGVAFQFGF